MKEITDPGLLGELESSDAVSEEPTTPAKSGNFLTNARQDFQNYLNEVPDDTGVKMGAEVTDQSLLKDLEYRGRQQQSNQQTFLHGLGALSPQEADAELARRWKEAQEARYAAQEALYAPNTANIPPPTTKPILDPETGKPLPGQPALPPKDPGQIYDPESGKPLLDPKIAIDRENQKRMDAYRASVAEADKVDPAKNPQRPFYGPLRSNVDAFTRTALQGINDTAIRFPGTIGGALMHLTDGTKSIDDHNLKKAGDLLDAEIKRLFPEDELRQQDFAQQLSSGGGSLASFMAGGLAAKTLGMPVKASIAALGAAQGGVQQSEDARQHHASDNARLAALAIGSGLGMTEALPLGRFFDRLNAVTKGRVTQILRDSAANSLEEFMQEVTQQLGGNAAAQQLYDTDRSLWEGVPEAGKTAAILGGALGLASGGTAPHISTLKKQRYDVPAGPEQPPQLYPSPAGPLPPIDPRQGQNLPGLTDLPPDQGVMYPMYEGVVTPGQAPWQMGSPQGNPTVQDPLGSEGTALPGFQPGAQLEQQIYPENEAIIAPEEAPWNMGGGGFGFDLPPVRDKAPPEALPLPPSEEIAPAAPEIAPEVAPEQIAPEPASEAVRQNAVEAGNVAPLSAPVESAPIVPEAQPVTQALPEQAQVQPAEETLDEAEVLEEIQAQSNASPEETKMLQSFGYPTEAIQEMSRLEIDDILEDATGIRPQEKTSRKPVSEALANELNALAAKQAIPAQNVQTPVQAEATSNATQGLPQQDREVNVPDYVKTYLGNTKGKSVYVSPGADVGIQGNAGGADTAHASVIMPTSRNPESTASTYITNLADNGKAVLVMPEANDAVSQERRQTFLNKVNRAFNVTDQFLTADNKHVIAISGRKNGRTSGTASVESLDSSLQGPGEGAMDAGVRAERGPAAGFGQPSEIRSQSGRVGGGIEQASAPSAAPRNLSELRELDSGLADQVEEQASAVRQVAGKSVPIRFMNELARDPEAGKLHGKENTPGARAVGQYSLDKGEIRLAFRPGENAKSVAFHEAFHAIELGGHLTDTELSILRKDVPKLRTMAAKKVGKDVADSLDPVEVTAIAFEQYIKDRQNKKDTPGLAASVKRVFQKIFTLLRKALVGKAEDIYEAAFKGKYAERGKVNKRSADEIFSKQSGSGKTSSVEALRAPLNAQQTFQTPEEYAETARTKIGSMWGKGMYKFRKKAQDRFLAINNLQEAIKKGGGTVGDINNVYRAEELYYGATGEKLERFEEGELKDLIHDMSDANIQLEDLGEYMQMRHAQERNAMIAARNPKMPDGGSGITNAEAQKYLDKMQTDPKIAEYERLAKKVDQINKGTREQLLRYGLISQDMFNEWEKMKTYVPLRGWKGENEEWGLNTGRGFDIDGPESKHALGRTTRAENPIVYSIAARMQSVVRGEKNKVAQAFYRLATQNPNEKLWSTEQDKTTRYLVKDKKTGKQNVVERRDTVGRDPNAVGVKIGGKNFYVVVHNKDILKAMTTMGSSGLNDIGKFAHKYVSLLSRMSTQWNPEFIITNFMRDMETALVTIGDQDVKWKRAKLMKTIPQAMQGVFNGKRGDYNSEWAKVYKEFRENGGEISFIPLLGVEEIESRILRDFKREGKGYVATGQRALKGLGDIVDLMNGTIENGGRLAVYKMLRDSGKSPREAASAARNLTVNFNRRGEWGPVMNATWMFMNASIQGSATLMTKAYRSKAVRRGMYMMIVAGFLEDWMNAMNQAIDDDGEGTWDKISEEAKDRSIYVMLPGDKNGTYFRMPIGYGLNAFKTLGRKVSEIVRGKPHMDPIQATGQALKSLAGAYNPFGTESVNIVPTILRPLAELKWTNRNFMGIPIVPEGGDKLKPQSERYYDSVGWVWKDMASGLNAATGGNPWKSGWVDISPEALEHVYDFALGGVGRFVGNAAKTISSVMHGEDVMPETTPFLRNVFGQKTAQMDKSLFYEMRNQIDGVEREFKGAQSDDDMDVIRSLRQNNKAEIASIEAFKAADKEIRQVNKQEKELAKNKAIPDERRKELKLRLKQQEAAAMERARKVYNQALKKYNG